jgi:circadian clock protein KaiC
MRVMLKRVRASHPLMDTWIKLRHFETSSERNRVISIIKSRGMMHSNQIHESLLTDQGVEIMDVYLGQEGGLLMGTDRAAQESKDRTEMQVQKHEIDRRKRSFATDMFQLNFEIHARISYKYY